jgi:hypothetical protein
MHYRKANSNSKTIISNGWKRRSTSWKLRLNVEMSNFLRKKTQSFMIVSLEIGGGGGGCSVESQHMFVSTAPTKKKPAPGDREVPPEETIL